jgi:hypothetical protein
MRVQTRSSVGLNHILNSARLLEAMPEVFVTHATVPRTSVRGQAVSIRSWSRRPASNLVADENLILT